MRAKTLVERRTEFIEV